MSRETRLRRWGRREYAMRLIGRPRRTPSWGRDAGHRLIDLLFWIGIFRDEERHVQNVIDELGGDR